VPNVEVKNVSLNPIDLPSGALIVPGAIARGVEDDDALIESYLNDGALVVVESQPAPAPAKPARTRKKETQS
jgi:hypothetical protein